MEGDGSGNGFDSGAAALKKRLEPWREIALLVQRLLTWEKPLFPAIITGVTTLLYLILYCMDMSNLTLFPLLVAFVLISDVVVPFIAPKVFDPAKWGAAQENQFEEICDTIAKGLRDLTNVGYQICQSRENSPRIFLVCSLGVLFFLSWLGSVLNGFFAAWVLTLFALLAPGLKQNGVLDKAIQFVMTKAKLH
ncbi:ADP-ribosylation factor-like protein 6-interacting protein 1 isoform X2 [Varroa jacobsoni]|uniref:RETREG1-3/ARL6IP-like N-terminal reticulon-homology domain-containing protein n=1 Tax=Varroa destructor TaxID=109461 RepID=A0A7M7ME45_VARDE|nr:ADP-ribosylation factor-like protein 6-interacting protein 1 isoform X2 [Varroa destructor]XP_022693251.1 ADP-ribosylation factor-like protein 6-interacting protein 1 isoform X2 [Varroa jacobsoni]